MWLVSAEWEFDISFPNCHHKWNTCCNAPTYAVGNRPCRCLRKSVVIIVVSILCGNRNSDIQTWKVFRIGTVRYNWPMSVHASQAFSIAHCTNSEDLPKASPKKRKWSHRTCVVVYWVVKRATPCLMCCFGRKFAFEFLEIALSAH